MRAPAAPEHAAPPDGTAVRRRRLRPGRLLALALAIAWLAIAAWHVHKPLPDGVRVAGTAVPVPSGSLQFLADVTAADPYGNPVREHVIHATLRELVRDARDFLLVDMFLFNGQGGPAGPLRYGDGLTPVSQELLEALRELRRAQPALPVLVLVDPINDYYRGTAPPQIAALSALGIDVVVTRLDALRDSNPLYSGTWRLLAGWWLPQGGTGRWPNLLDAAGPKLPLAALTRLPHFKANHRKVLLTGDGAGSLVGLVTSANPHDASSAHSNVALRLQGEALRPLLASELAIARFSGWPGAAWATALEAPGVAAPGAAIAAAAPAATYAGVVTEGAIRDALLERVGAAGRGDAIDVAQFYLSDRPVIDALLAAAARGATVRVLLDPNKDAFGFEKSGIPNRQVAGELIAASDGAIQLRWYRTHGEQFHAKLAAVRRDGRVWFTLGSANFTRRNLGDYNLEANVFVDAPATDPVAVQVGAWFERLWTNHPGAIEYSADADVYAEPGFARYWLYRAMEASGLSTF